MNQKKEVYDEDRSDRVKRVKKILRYLPRRANLHRYPFIKFFADPARRRPYLWSFRASEVVPALYAGFVLTFMPLYGVQIPLALGLSFLFRANLMVLVGLQLISNPFTIIPIYAAAYQIGHFSLSIFGANASSFADAINAETGMVLGTQTKKAIRAFMEMMLGGALMGYIAGLVSSFFYKRFAKIPGEKK